MAVDGIISSDDYKVSLVPPPPLPSREYHKTASGCTIRSPSATLDVEKMMLYRGVGVTYEAIRYWCRK